MRHKKEPQKHPSLLATKPLQLQSEQVLLDIVSWHALICFLVAFRVKKKRERESDMVQASGRLNGANKIVCPCAEGCVRFVPNHCTLCSCSSGCEHLLTKLIEARSAYFASPAPV